jgi:hypothetical protein
MQQGTTITLEVYCETLNKLRKAIQNKRCGMLTSGVVLLHDNARPHRAAGTRALLERFNWELFTCLKNCLWSQRFNSNEELMVGIKTWLSSQVAD